eukprot:11001516-Lingulodinium_polyedra.AAC.1
MNRRSATTKNGTGESAWSAKRRPGLQSSQNGLKQRRRRTQTMQRSGRFRRLSKWRTKDKPTPLQARMYSKQRNIS